ncbi:hypothetical protein THAR02_09718 [Trichoderma harzianum]|uniref:Uncharacterized protein n=1 Tax=Trichoderma harzianum TaxID=5544 RepID=A0A0F9X0I9_TRIHA|nr:hypothetical protein THAR02_09718 [Trichoderma harzianum]
MHAHKTKSSNKLRSQNTYPIQKPDICRIKKSLGVFKETLDLALQNLELSCSCLTTSKLRNLETASQQASNGLTALDYGISTLHTKSDDILGQLQHNNTIVAAALDGEDPRKAIYKLAYKPKEYGNALRREHYYAAIRSITFDALGIAHTCRCAENYTRNPELDAVEIAEIQDEYAELLELLESLIEEFETHAFEVFDEATDRLGSMITFWNGYWVQRMNEVLYELSTAGEERKAAAEDLGVVWGPHPERETYEDDEWKGWGYYFQQIEEIESMGWRVLRHVFTSVSLHKQRD